MWAPSVSAAGPPPSVIPAGPYSRSHEVINERRANLGSSISMTTMFEKFNLKYSEIHLKYAEWAPLKRLEGISIDIDEKWKAQDEWNVNEELFRRGMGLEAVRG